MPNVNLMFFVKKGLPLQQRGYLRKTKKKLCTLPRYGSPRQEDTTNVIFFQFRPLLDRLDLETKSSCDHNRSGVGFTFSIMTIVDVRCRK